MDTHLKHNPINDKASSLHDAQMPHASKISSQLWKKIKINEAIIENWRHYQHPSKRALYAMFFRQPLHPGYFGMRSCNNVISHIYTF